MRSTRFAAAIAAGLLILAGTSCSKDRLRGEGPDVTDTRTVNAFSQVELTGGNNATIVKDNEYKVIVTGRQNLVPAFETYVSGGVLKMKFQDKYHNIQDDNIRLEIHTPSVSAVSVTGSGNMVMDGAFTGNLDAAITGSGDMDIDNGSFETLKAEVTGSGNLDASGSVCKKGYARISGSGNIDLHVTEYLSVDISGSGNVNYWGSPASTDQIVTGSGKVSRRN